MASRAAGTIQRPTAVRRPSPGALVRGRRGQPGHRGGEPRQLAQRAAQILGQLAGGLIAVLRLLHQASADDGDDGRRHVRSGDVDQRRIHREMLGQHALEAGPAERHPPGEHLVDHAAEAVDVAAAVHRRRRGRLLRAHVGRGADGEADTGQRGAAGQADRPRDAEVGDHRVAVRDEDVLRLDVAVHHPAPVGVVQRVRHLPARSSPPRSSGAAPAP